MENENTKEVTTETETEKPSFVKALNNVFAKIDAPMLDYYKLRVYTSPTIFNISMSKLHDVMDLLIEEGVLDRIVNVTDYELKCVIKVRDDKQLKELVSSKAFRSLFIGYKIKAYD